MTDQADGGREFAPGEHPDEGEQAASRTHGAGKGFSPSVDDPDTDADATTEGSGKQFSPSVEDPEDEASDGRGTGKQFEPGRHEL